MFPDYIDAPDLPDAERIKALRELHNDLRTPHPSLVETKPKGGTNLSYVGHAAVTEMLLRHDPLWSWRPVGTDMNGSPIIDRNADGRPIGMWIYLTIFDHHRMGYGSVEPTDRRSDGDLIKEIIGDGIRNAAMRFGIALNLWSKNDLEVAAPEETAHDKVIAQAKGWTKAKRDKIKADLKTHGIIDDPANFEEFASSVVYAAKTLNDETLVNDIEGWLATNNEKKIVKDLEEIATDE